MSYEKYLDKIDHYNNNIKDYQFDIALKNKKLNLEKFGKRNDVTVIYRKRKSWNGRENEEDYDVYDNDDFTFVVRADDQDVYYIFNKDTDKLVCVWIDDWDWLDESGNTNEELCYLDENYKSYLSEDKKLKVK